VLRISAVDSGLQLASFSNRRDIDLTAPGASGLPALIGGGYATHIGTSDRHALSGILALMHSGAVCTTSLVPINSLEKS
jgi:subtilisin family serine protease